MPITYTPLRFPGGKSKIYPFVVSLIDENNLRGCTYAEGFCGGAGLAIKLLIKGDVSKIVLNDYDPAVYSIWDAVVNHPDELCEYIMTVQLDVDQWRVCRAIYHNTTSPSLDLGMAAFYLNRTNRSGILPGGVIGGQEQTGTYKIDARFNRDALCKKIRMISERADDIELHNLNIFDFMQDVAPNLGSSSLLYLDPPYVQKGPELYENSFTDRDHKNLAKCIKSYEGRWMVTYDVDALVDKLYAPSDDWKITTSEIIIGYSAANTRNLAPERLVLSPKMSLPSA